MVHRRTRSLCSKDNEITEVGIEMPTSTKTVITKAAHAKVEAEKNAAVAQLETLKEKYDGMLKKNDDLEQSISILKQKIGEKAAYVEKYKTKCVNIKEKIHELQETITVLESGAETADAKIESLNKSKKILEQKKEELLDELEQHKQAFFESSLKYDGFVRHGNRNNGQHSCESNTRSSLKHTSRGPYQLSSHNHHRRSPTEYHRRH